MKKIVATGLMMALAACGGADSPPEATQRQAGELTLSYGPCFGSCPVFTVTLNHNGTLRYEGERFVAVTGRETRFLSPSTFEDIAALVRDMPETELQDPMQCPRRRTDHPHVSGGLDMTGDFAIEISHYYGCYGYEWRERQVQAIRKITEMLDIDDLVGWDPNRRVR